jgi:hypothetical protein
MSSADAINGIIDTLIARLNANSVLLGISKVTETDQEPRYLDPPEAYVIPFVEGKDTIGMYAGGDEHTYPINIVAFYKCDDIQTGLRPTRTYGLNALDLFNGDNGTLITSSGLYGAEANSALLEVGYWRVGDYIMHYWSLQLQMRQIV